MTDPPHRPGALNDAVDPFVKALTAAAGKLAEPAADPKAVAAVQLGWLLADVRGGRPIAEAAQLDAPAGVGFSAQSPQLAALAKLLDIDAAALTTVTAALDAGTRAPEGDAKTLADRVLATLLGADLGHARAYDLGARLNALDQAGYGAATFKADHAPKLVERLDSLSTVLPPHAARGVANSVRRWVAYTGPQETAAAVLHLQCALWRTILTGEKHATQLLEPENYLDAARRMAGKLTAAAALALSRSRLLLVVVVVLLAAGVYVLARSGTSSAPGTAAGLSGLLAAFGLTWKGIGGTIGKLAARLEAPLWGAELDGAVTDAVTMIVQQEPKQGPLTRLRSVEGGDYAGRRALAGGKVID